MMILLRKIIPPAAFSMLLSTACMAASTHTDNNNSIEKTRADREVFREIKVTQVDNMFLPSEIWVTEGETIRFIVINKGNHQHEMRIGTLQELKEAAKMRRNYPDENPVETGMVRLQPGQQEEMIRTFDQPGKVDFACPLPGHFKVMRGKIYVEKK